MHNLPRALFRSKDHRSPQSEWGDSDRAHDERRDDYISSVDGTEDFVSCGPGADRARANPGDNVAEGCEQIIREGVRVD